MTKFFGTLFPENKSFDAVEAEAAVIQLRILTDAKAGYIFEFYRTVAMHQTVRVEDRDLEDVV